MKLLSFLLAFGFAAFCSTSHALSSNEEIPPGPQHVSPLAFDIHSERLPTGETQFTINITENIGSQSRFAEFPKDYTTDLGIVKITEYSGKETISGFPMRSEESSSIRRLTSKREGDVITCVFSVTKKELENPDLCFRFVIPFTGFAPSYDAYFARLRKFIKP